MDDIYRQYILDHYREPRNHGTLEHPDIHAADTNPLCGDRIEIDLRVDGDRVSEVRFRGRGCAISQASASMLTEKIEGATLEELRVLHEGIGGPYTGRMDDDLDEDAEPGDAAAGLAERDRTGL